MKRAGAEADYRRALAHRLREKSTELEEAIFERIRALDEGSGRQSRRSEGLRLLIKSLVEYGAIAVELGERQCPPPPPTVLDHARKAAWASIPPLLLHERYLAAQTVFNRFLRKEARSVKGYVVGALSQVQESNDVVFERLFRVAGEELDREIQKKRRSAATRQLERVQALLAGELLEAPELDYDFEATHLGIVGTGEGVFLHIKQAIGSSRGSLLIVQPAPQKCWAWVGARGHLTSSRLKEILSAECPPQARIAVGEPASGLIGWRHTHRAATAGLVVAHRFDQPVVRHDEALMLAWILDSDVLRAALETKYLIPLSKGRNGSNGLMNTLRAYYAANRSGKAAAAKLNVSPQTVSNHLRRVEELLGRPLGSCGVELEVAVLLADALESSQNK